MSDDERDIRALLEAEAERAPRPQGLRRGTVRRGMGRRISVVALPLLVVASVAWVAVAQPFASDPRPKVVGPGPVSDQGRIAFSRFGTDGGIMTMNADGSDLKTVVESVNKPLDNPAWSPDGKRIAFHVPGDTSSEQGAVVTAHAGEFETDLDPVGIGDMPTWSPDGERIAFTRGGTMLISSLTGDEQHSFINVEGEFPDWSPDGERIAFIRGDLYIVPSDGGVPTKLLDNEESFAVHPSWSPDGSQIAFTTPATEPEHNQIRIVQSDGTGLRFLTEGSSPTWSPDGTSIAFERIDGDESHIYSIKIDGTYERQLTSGDVADHSPDWGPAVPSPGPKEVATFGRYTFSIGGGFDGQRGPEENVGVVEVNSADGSVCVQSYILGSSSAHLHRYDAPDLTITVFQPPTDYRSTLCARDLDRTALQEVIEDPSAYFIEFHKESPDGTLTAPLEIMGELEDDRSGAPYCVGDEICLSRSGGPAGIDVTASIPASGTGENGVDVLHTDKVEWWWGLRGDQWIDVFGGNPPEGAFMLASSVEPTEDRLVTSFIVPLGQDPGTYPIFAIAYGSDGGEGAAGTEIDFELTDGYGCPTLLPPGPKAEFDARPVIDAYLESRQPDGTRAFNYRVERLERAMPEGPGGNCPEETWLRSYQVEGNFVWKEGEQTSASLSYFRFLVGRAEGDWVVWAVFH